MNTKRGFTLIELLVVIAIIALLMSILMPAMQRVKKQARAVACMSRLKQWALWFKLYTDDYDSHFMEGFAGVNSQKAQRSGSTNNRWCKAMGEYHKWESEIACCPSASKPWFDENGNATGLSGQEYFGARSAWGYYQRTGWLKPFKGSYGINGWVNNPDPGHHHGGKPEKDHWRTPNVKGAAYVPLFLGAQRYNVWPEHTDPPPQFDGQTWSGSQHMSRVCLNRHNGFVNGIFLDFSARKIGLKQLWKLKWHRSYPVEAPPPIWPDWMRSFKAY